mgnify:CR=1 FL=1
MFIDWSHDDAPRVWSEGLTDLFKKVPYDGLWLDMNEPTARFCDGECPIEDDDDFFDERLEDFEQFEELRSFAQRCKNF